MLYSKRGLANGHRYAMQSSEMMEALGLKPSGHLPDEGMPPQFIDGVEVYVNPKPPSTGRKSSKHRVMVVCPMCKRHMSAGRFVSQHFKVHRTEYGYIVRVENKHGNFWLGQRLYFKYDSALVVKHNVADSKQHDRVYIVPATKEQFETALSKV